MKPYSRRELIVILIIGIGFVGFGSFLFYLQHYGLQQEFFEEVVPVGEVFSYNLTAPKHSQQKLNFTSDTFDLFLEAPSDGLKIRNVHHRNNVTISWVHVDDGNTVIKVTNTGEIPVVMTGLFTKSGDHDLDLVLIGGGFILIGAVFYNKHKNAKNDKA